MRFLLHPGETLNVPSGWWYSARILEPSITVSVNGAICAHWRDYPADYPLYYTDGRRWKGSLATSRLAVVGLLLNMAALQDRRPVSPFGDRHSVNRRFGGKTECR